MPGQRLVDTVVDYLEHHVVQPGAIVDITDVHAGTFSHRFQAAKDRDLAGVVGVVGGNRRLRLGHRFSVS